MNEMQDNYTPEELAEISEKLTGDMQLAFKKRGTDPQCSYDLLMSVYQQSIKFQLPKLELNALHAICSISHNFATGKSPEYWIDILKQRGTEFSDNLSVGRSYIHRYRWARQDSQYLEAARFLNLALGFLDHQLDTGDVSACYTGLGNIHLQLDEYDKAEKYYQQALALLKDKPLRNSFNLRQNIASLHLLKKDYAKAWQGYHDLLPILSDSDFFTRIMVLQNLGHICHVTNQLSEAVEYFQEALFLKLHTGSHEGLIRTFCNLINVYISLNLPDKVIENLQKAEKFLSTDNLTDQIEIMQTYIKYYKMTDDLSSQIQYYEKLIIAKDKLSHKENIVQINKLEAQRQTDSDKDNGKVQNLQHCWSSIDEIIAMITHQCKQPLNIINSLMFNIKDTLRYNELTVEYIEDKVNKIDELTQYLSQTLNDFGSFFTEDNSIDFRASSAVRRALSLLSYALNKENVSVTTDFEADFSIHGSQNELTQVFFYLINNALDALKSNEVSHPAVRIDLAKKSDHNLITIYNNGGAIPENLIDKIFDAYVTTKGENGTGLGLNISKIIIEEHFKGKISLKNTNQGVVFILDLPVIS
ncbi:MAG: tetratricopeptide repeat protein [Candidatus Cloacimonetes bacterium]|nr:tetratricopeptide repeat protein [Candidatus Cloacimonadota bacterium]